MQSSPNWSKLYEQGRCKEIGVPWTDEEMKAIYELKIPYEYVRLGCKTLEDYNKTSAEAESTSEKPLIYLKRDELVKKAVALGISFDVDAVSRQTLMAIIKEKQAQA